MSRNKGKEILERLRKGEIILADGAANVVLTQNRLDIGGGTAQHNITHYDLIAKLHKDYAAVGSQIAFANTLHASRHSLSRHSLEDKIGEINFEGIRAAKESGNPVFGLVTSAYGVETSLFDKEYIKGNYAEQIAYLRDVGCDFIYLLTHVDLVDAKCAVAAAKEQAKDLPIALAFTFGHDSSVIFCYDHTSTGATLTGIVKEFKDEVDVLGFNCGTHPFYSKALLQRFRELTDMPLIVQPNAGKPNMDGITYQTNPEDFARSIHYAVEANNGQGLIVGGCCGTTPEYIRQVKKTLIKPLKT